MGDALCESTIGLRAGGCEWSCDDWTDLDQVTTFCEMMGVLYKRGMANLDLVDDLIAGSLVLTWNA